MTLHISDFQMPTPSTSMTNGEGRSQLQSSKNWRATGSPPPLAEATYFSGDIKSLFAKINYRHLQSSTHCGGKASSRALEKQTFFSLENTDIPVFLYSEVSPMKLTLSKLYKVMVPTLFKPAYCKHYDLVRSVLAGVFLFILFLVTKYSFFFPARCH